MRKCYFFRYSYKICNFWNHQYKFQKNSDSSILSCSWLIHKICIQSPFLLWKVDEQFSKRWGKRVKQKSKLKSSAQGRFQALNLILSILIWCRLLVREAVLHVIRTQKLLEGIIMNLTLSSIERVCKPYTKAKMKYLHKICPLLRDKWKGCT